MTESWKASWGSLVRNLDIFSYRSLLTTCLAREPLHLNLSNHFKPTHTKKAVFYQQKQPARMWRLAERCKDEDLKELSQAHRCVNEDFQN